MNPVLMVGKSMFVLVGALFALNIATRDGAVDGEKDALQAQAADAYVAYFAGQTNGDTLSKPAALAAYRLVVKGQAIDPQTGNAVRPEVLGFRMTVVQVGYRRVVLRSNSSLITEKMQDALAYITPYDSLLIDNIVIRTLDGQRTKVGELRFRVGF